MSTKIKNGNGSYCKTMNVIPFNPLTESQSIARQEFEKGKHLFYIGFPGTGKTHLAIHFAMDELQTDKTKKKVIIIRSCVPGRDMGFLPGNAEEKMESYESPYPSIFNHVIDRGDGYEILKKKGFIEFESTSFLRGQTLDDSIVIVDEFQNMARNEIHTIMTRIGENTKLHVCGDIGQSDLLDSKKTGASDLISIAKEMNDISIIHFDEVDIIRSDFCKNYILTKMRLESKGVISIS